MNKTKEKLYNGLDLFIKIVVIVLLIDILYIKEYHRTIISQLRLLPSYNYITIILFIFGYMMGLLILVIFLGTIFEKDRIDRKNLNKKSRMYIKIIKNNNNLNKKQKDELIKKEKIRLAIIKIERGLDK